ncbi:MAG: hypothetical protein IME95_01620 [Proteobacteria bacterium]|nr:hypothetical protein [Pseudomonadota bacterium]
MMDKRRNIKSKPPVHPSACFLTIVLDWLWFLVELVKPLTIERPLTLLMIVSGAFITCFIPVSLIQRLGTHNPWKSSISKGLLMGIAVAVPYPVVGTFVGVILLATARFSLRIQSDEPDE